MIQDRQWLDVELVGFVEEVSTPSSLVSDATPILGSLSDTSTIVVSSLVDDVIVALPRDSQHRLVQLVAEFQSLPVRVYVVPDLFDLAFFRTTVEAYDGIPLIGLRDPVIDGFPRFAKRAFDLIVVILLLPLLLPLMAAVALAIKLDSPGPVFYRQQRAARTASCSRCLKFRSMYHDAEKRLAEVVSMTGDGHVLFKTDADPRITPVGRSSARPASTNCPNSSTYYGER